MRIVSALIYERIVRPVTQNFKFLVQFRGKNHTKLYIVFIWNDKFFWFLILFSNIEASRNFVKNYGFD